MKAFFHSIPEGPGNTEITDSELQGPVLIANRLCSNSSDLLHRAEFPVQVRLNHSDSSTKIWEGLCLEMPSGVCGLRERCTT